MRPRDGAGAPVLEGCRSCREPLPSGAHFCPSCGSSSDPAVLSLLRTDTAGTADAAGMAEVRPGGNRRWVLLTLAVVAALVALWRAGSDETDSGPEPPSATTATTARPTTTIAAARTSSAAPTTAMAIEGQLQAAADVVVPAGLEGHLFSLTSTGMLLRTDLATGATVVLDTAMGDDLRKDGRHRMVPVTGGLLVQTHAPGPVIAITDAGERRVVAERVTLLGGHGDLAVVTEDDRAVPRAALVDVGGVRSVVELRAGQSVVGLVGGRLVVQMAELIAFVDPADGAVAPITTGTAVAAGPGGLARLACGSGRCELIAGPWEDHDRHRIPARAGVDWWQGVMSPAGTHLLLTQYDRRDPPRWLVFDLEAGRSALVVDLSHGPGELMTFTPDGRWLLGLEGSRVGFYGVSEATSLRVHGFPEGLAAIVAR